MVLTHVVCVDGGGSVVRDGDVRANAYKKYGVLHFLFKICSL